MLDSASTGFWISIIIALLFLGEFLAQVFANPESHFEKLVGEEKENVQDRGDMLQSRAQGLTVLVIAIGSIILSSPEITAGSVLVLIGLSITFLIVSYQTRSLSASRRAFYILQNKTLAYGFLSFVVATAVFFRIQLPAVLPILGVGLAGVVLIRVIQLAYEFYIDMRSWGATDYDNRRAYFREKLDR